MEQQRQQPPRGAGLDTAANFASICRTCAASTEYLMPIYHGEGLQNSLADKIRRHLPIQVCESDVLPLQLCYQCASTLLAWHELVTCCAQADAALRTRLARLQELATYESNVPTTSKDEIPNEKSELLEQKEKCDIGRITFEAYSLAQSALRDPEHLTSTHPETVLRQPYGQAIRNKASGRSETTLHIKCESDAEFPYDDDIYTDAGKEQKQDDEDDDDQPLVHLATSKNKLQLFNNFYKALVNFKKHYESHLEQSDESTTDFSDTESEEISDTYNIGPDNEYDDLTLHNKRKDCFDDDTREQLKTAKTLIDGQIYYQCQHCGKNLRTTHTYIHHMRIHSGEKPCVCHLCGKQFRVNAGLHRHLKETHQKIKVHSCNICHKRFSNRQNLIQHNRIHTGEKPYVCTQCGKRFTQSGSLYVHMKTHTNYYPYECSSCEAKFRQRSGLTHHMYKHTGEKPNVCAYCGKAYRVRYELNMHMLIHTDQRPYACPACGLAFRQRRTMRNHCKRTHGIVPQHDTVKIKHDNQPKG